MSLPSEVLAVVETFLEIMPGVPASAENLERLLEHVSRNGFIARGGEEGTTIPMMGYQLVVKGAGRNKKLELIVAAPFVNGPDHTVYNALRLLRMCYPATPDGMLAALVDAKEAKRSFMERGPCPACLSNRHVSLRAAGMPLCGDCMLTAILR